MKFWVERYCRSNLLSDIREGSTVLADELTEGNFLKLPSAAALTGSIRLKLGSGNALVLPTKQNCDDSSAYRYQLGLSNRR